MSVVQILSFLTVFSSALTLFFGYLFYQDRDKRKLMFMLVFAFVSFVHLGELIHGFGNTISVKIFTWGHLPITSAMLIAVVSSLGNKKDFRKPFYVFLTILSTSIIMMAAPLSININLGTIYEILLSVTIFLSIYVVLNRKKLPDTMFLLSTVCFTLAEFSRITRFAEIEVALFMEISAYIFIALVFVTAKESKGSNIASFFVLENELKKTQQELEISQDQLMKAEYNFKSLVNVIADPVVIVDKKGNFLEINDTVVDVTGFSKEELLGKNFLKTSIVTTKSKAILIKKLTERMLGIDVKPYEVEANTKDGKIVNLEVNAKKLEYDGKEADLVLFHDITDRKKMEAEQEKYAEQLEKEVKQRTRTLKEKEEKYKKLVELAPDSIMICDTNGVITSANTATAIMSGYSKKELVGKNFKELMDIKSPNIPKYKKVLQFNGTKKRPVQFDILYHRKDGTTAFGEVRFSSIQENDKTTGIQAIIRDITERKQMEDELMQYSERLEELVEKRTTALKESQQRLLKAERLAAIGQAATMVGHDLRNPLQAIENGIYYINTELANFPVSKKTTKTLQAIHNSIDYADNIVKDLQSFASRREPSLRETDINELIKEVLSQIETPANVEATIESSELPKIEIDKDMIKRIFVNLAVNGIQAMKKKGGTMKIATKQSNDYIEVSFTDTGSGIKKELIQKIFTPFFTTKAQGMGVGLAICKRFIELHEGTIEVESLEGKGSTFTVKLPINTNGGGKT
ncbi:MAG: hypothetical protein CW691_09430 [Candidatus Bathyarchaeum sp.]|nr:MAG: hypothetical protein CW691_09430 [Candidatus Bathyarchaeum sp.]